jgi:hypothetical protein
MSFIVNPYVYSSPLCADADGNAFLIATGITNPTIVSAICTLVTSLKSQGIWSKLDAIYPFVGGTATTHMYNLKNPANTNAAFRLGFIGGWTHSANGALPNGTNAYADTYYNFNTQTNVNNACFGAYIRTNNTAGLQVYGSFTFINTTRAFQNLSNGNIQIASANIIIYTANPSTGFFFSRRTSSTFNESYRNGVSLGTTTASTTNLPAFNFYFGATNNSGTATFFCSHQIAFGVLGGSASMTNTDASNLYSTIQTFQTTLGRQV